MEGDNTLRIKGIEAGDRARQKDFSSQVYGVMPGVFEAMISDFVMVGSENTTTALSLGEQLYTARGSQGVGIGTIIAKQARAENPEENWRNQVTMIFERETPDKSIYYQVRNIFNNDRAPGFTMYEKASQ